MSDDFTCTAGLPWCSAEEDRRNGHVLHSLDHHQVTAHGKQYMMLKDWTVNVKATASAVTLRAPDGTVADECVRFVRDGAEEFYLTADEAEALGVSLIAAAFRLGGVSRDEVHADLAVYLDDRQAVAA